jgi:hypothetical protein
MKVNIDGSEEKVKVTDFVFTLYEITLMSRPALWPSQSVRLLFNEYQCSFPGLEEAGPLS